MPQPATTDMRGVTSIEMLVAVGVVGLLLAVAAPALSGLVERQHLRGAGDTVAGDLRLARSELQRRGAAANPMVLSFGGNAHMSCYTLHTALAAPGSPALPYVCDCTRTPGNTCMPLGVRQELKTVQLRRATGVALAASSGSVGALMFLPPNGEAMPNDMRIDLQGAHGATLRLRPGVAGAVSQCSPDGNMAGMPPC